MNFLRSGFIQEFGGLTELCSSYDGIIDEDDAPVSYELLYGKQLHLGDQITLALNGGHEGSWPGGCVLDEGS